MKAEIKSEQESQSSELQASSASGRRLRAQGQRTRELIIQEAKKVLLEGGSLQFALRTVARRARISISNLQYYFPTRESLLRAIVEPIVSRYHKKSVGGFADEAAAKATLIALIDATLADVRDPEVSAIWLHFASLSMTDPESARVLDAAHIAFARDIGRLIRTINPALSHGESRDLARILIAMVDGFVFQIGAGHKLHRSAAGLNKQLHQMAMLLITQGSSRT
jgi:AcrR family transcriptional regulator